MKFSYQPKAKAENCGPERVLKDYLVQLSHIINEDIGTEKIEVIC